MVLRAVKSLGEHPNQRGAGHGGASTRLMADGVSGPGGRAAQSEGVKDMNSGDRESVTEGSESHRDVSESMKQHRDAGKSDDLAGLTGKPEEKVDKQQLH